MKKVVIGAIATAAVGVGLVVGGISTQPDTSTPEVPKLLKDAGRCSLNEVECPSGYCAPNREQC